MTTIAKAPAMQITQTTNTQALVASMLEKIETIDSRQDAREVVQNVYAMEAALRQLKRFREISGAYAAAEIRMFQVIIERGYVNGLNEKDREIAAWLSSKKDWEVKNLINSCSDGATLRSRYDDEHVAKMAAEEIHEMQKAADGLVAEYKKTGRVVLDAKAIGGDVTRYAIAKKQVEPIIDNTRRRLRQAGAAGVGDGVYLDLYTHREEVLKSVRIRTESILRDVYNLADEVSACGFRYEDVKDEIVTYEPGTIGYQLQDAIAQIINASRANEAVA